MPELYACCVHCEHDDGYRHEDPCTEGCNDDA